MAIPDSLRHQIELFRETGRVAILDRAGFAEPSFVAMMMGLGVAPKRYDPLADRIDIRAVHGHFAELRDMIAQTVTQMPGHGAYVAGQAQAATAPSRAAA
jgi:tryptophan halogenase